MYEPINDELAYREYNFEKMPDVIGDWQALDGLSDMDSINTGKITFWINIRTVQFKVVHLKFSEIKGNLINRFNSEIFSIFKIDIWIKTKMRKFYSIKN